MIGGMKAELDMLAWESQLPDPPTITRILTVTGGVITEESMERLRQYVQNQMIGGCKCGQGVVLEGVPVDEHCVDKVRISVSEDIVYVSEEYDRLMDEYLGIE